MILEIKQVTASKDAHFDIIDLLKKYRFGYAVVRHDEKTQKATVKVNIAGHSYTLYELRSARGAKFGVRTSQGKIAELVNDITMPSFVSYPSGEPRFGRTAVLWRDSIYTMHEVPIRSDGLYYPILNEDGETVSIIERATKIANGKECCVCVIEADKNVSMALMSAFFIFASTTGFEANNNISAALFELGMPELLPDAVSKHLDKTFIDRIVKRDIQNRKEI